jgi:hypothetical protein
LKQLYGAFDAACVEVERRIALDRAGRVIAEKRLPQTCRLF